MALSRWAKAHGKKEPPIAPKPVEPAPEPEPGVEMTDDERAYDLGLTGPATLEEADIIGPDGISADGREFGAAIDIARSVIDMLNNYDCRKGASS